MIALILSLACQLPPSTPTPVAQPFPTLYGAGESIAVLGDVDGDGAIDIALGTITWPQNRGMSDDGMAQGGAVFILAGPVDRDVELVSEALGRFGDNRSPLGSTLAAPGDVDGDGLADLLLASSANDGAVWLYTDPLADLEHAAWRLGGSGSVPLSPLMGGVGDLNGDGTGDVLLTAYEDGAGAYLFFGPPPASGYSATADADVVFMGEPGETVGPQVCRAGDVNGDGIVDLLVSAYGFDTFRGKTYLILGPFGEGEHDLADAEGQYLGEARWDSAGNGLAGIGDVDGDGLDDIGIGAANYQAVAERAGRAYVLFGPALGEIDLKDAPMTISGEHARRFVGKSITSLGDRDGDGLADVVIGSSVELALAQDLGPGDHRFAELPLLAPGPAIGEAASLGDVDGDGLDDLLIGGGHSSTEAYLVFGDRWPG